MPSPFEAAGAKVDPSKAAPLHTNRFFTGLWTQRSPLRDAATPYLYEKFYSASRYDSLIAGQDCEITTRLTLARRPGLSVYNSTALLYLRLAAFRAFVNGSEQIHVMADCAATGTAQAYGSVRDMTGPAGNTLLSAKVPGSRVTFFQSVGNILYYGDEAQCLKWVLSPTVWMAAEPISAGTYIVDTNNNIQVCTTPGVTGAAQPAWATTGTTADGSVRWTYRCSSVMKWGIFQPLIPPQVSQVTAASNNLSWLGNSYYNPALCGYDSVSNSVQKLTASGITASSPPAFNATIGAVTADGNARWTSLGTAAWQPNTLYAAGQIIYVNNPSSAGTYCFFEVTASGTSGATLPAFVQGTGSYIQDNTVVWQNIGPHVDLQAPITRSQNMQIQITVLDNKGGSQQAVVPGETGGTQPAWNEVLGQQTTDNNVVWTCVATPPNTTLPWVYAFSYRNSITGHESSATPLSKSVVPSVGSVVLLTGPGPSDPQVDTIRLYRSTQGQSSPFFLVDLPAVQGQSWSYYDSIPDDELNIFIPAPLNGVNNVPPNNLLAPIYYLGRVWGFDTNLLVYSGGPDTLTGNGNEAWPPLNYFSLPSRGVRLWATQVGLLAFTVSDVYIVTGEGTAASPFTCVIFQEGVGLLNYDSFAVNGSTAFLLTTAGRCISFDPGAGETEVGFPIGDLLSTYQVYGAHMAYHEGSSADTALYVGDGLTGWYRLSTISAPEQGMVWSPQGRPINGAATLASIEIAPGVKRLLVASYNPGPLLMRDATVNTDNGNLYQPWAVVGSIVLAQPGQIAGVEFITLDTTIAGSRATIGVRFGEIGGTWDFLHYDRQDPTLLPPSQTIRGERYYVAQNGTAAWCRHLQIMFQWPAEDAANELLSYTLYGEIKQERPEG